MFGEVCKLFRWADLRCSLETHIVVAYLQVSGFMVQLAVRVLELIDRSKSCR
jgi:hypothetical protein